MAKFKAKVERPGRRVELRQRPAAAGDEVAVVMERDEAPRTVEAPPDFARALAAVKAAQTTWDAFAPSHRKAYVDWIESAKQAATRARRAEKAVAMIRAKKKLQ